MSDLSANARAVFALLREDRAANLATLRQGAGLSERAFDGAVRELVDARLAQHPTPGRLGRVSVVERLSGLSSDASRLLGEIPEDRGLGGTRGRALLNDDDERYRGCGVRAGRARPR